MLTWASIVAAITGAAALVATDFSSFLTGLAELAAVITLFAIVCATEAFN